jgi:hypothetical protein
MLFTGFKHKECICPNLSLEAIPARKEASPGENNHIKR